MLRRLSLSVLVFVFISCSSSDDGALDLPDSDGDGISDVDEGAGEGVDTDGDGIDDYLDTDSDGDGILDTDELGEDGTPVDSDNDGVQDHLDTDSDNNGIPDAEEGTGDPDGDGIPDFADLDNDGDRITDITEIGEVSPPLDSDGDGTPDFFDTDSDNDNISDRTEGDGDIDGDLLPAFLDDDTDGDCIIDRIEAGDDDLSTPPLDTDGDGLHDAIELDSDNDGISDTDEDVNCNGIHDGGESSAKDADTDNDGVSDLVESVAGTNPNNPADNPQSNGDFFFLVPYQDATSPPEDTLAFRTSIQFADIYFSFDTTGSMFEELAAMADPVNGVPAIVDTLRCAPTGGTCLLDEDCAAGVCFNGLCVEDPLVGDGCIPDMWTGVGVFDEIDTYRNVLSLQEDPNATAGAIPGTGGGSREATLQAPACVADEANCENTNTNCADSGIGCPGFRPSAIRILIQITDADDQCSGPRCSLFTAATAGAALIAEGIRFLGLFGQGDEGGAGTAQSVAADIAIASGTVDPAGNPYVFAAQDAAVVPQTVNAVLEVVRGLPIDVTIEQTDVDGNALQFIDFLEVNVSGAGGCTNVSTTIDTNADTRDDSFLGLTPGTPICWDVQPVAVNTTQLPSNVPQVFQARLTVNGDGSPLDSRDVFFLVPPDIVQPPIN